MMLFSIFVCVDKVFPVIINGFFNWRLFISSGNVSSELIPNNTLSIGKNEYCSRGNSFVFIGSFSFGSLYSSSMAVAWLTLFLTISV